MAEGATRLYDGFQSLSSQRNGVPTIIKYNNPGDQLAIALSDHRLRVYQQVQATSKWTLLDQWRGHDAEIFEIQWVDCVHGQFLASIGGDNRYKLWQEAPSMVQGRRFRLAFSQSSQDHIFYVAMDHLSRNQDVYLGLVSQTGLLSLLEPTEPDTVSSWREIDALYPFQQMDRSIEPCFSLSFQQSVALTKGGSVVNVDSTSIMFAVSHRGNMKLYCSQDGQDEGLILREVATIPLDGSIVRSIMWANGTALLGNIIAMLFDNGLIKLFDIRYEKLEDTARDRVHGISTPRPGHSATRRNASSGISAGLAGLTRGNTTEPSDPQISESSMQVIAKEVGKLGDWHKSPITRITWSQAGTALVSMDADGVVSMWRQSTTGEWLKYAESSFT